MRTSDRVYLETAIVILGTDFAGRRFVENTKALVLSRRGAKIVFKQALIPLQVLTLRCMKTGVDTEVRVIGPITGAKEGCHFGITLVHPEVNVWGIDFPLLDGTENPAARVVLECADCQAQEVVHLEVFELEVLQANECLQRSCKQCRDTTLWLRSSSEEGEVPVVRVTADPSHTIQDRKAPRINLKVDACLRHSVYGEEVVSTEDVSRGGFRFISRKDYPLGTVIEAALPYSPGAANIFMPAKIVQKEAGEELGMFAHGAAYIPSPVAPSLTGMRISPRK